MTLAHWVDGAAVVAGYLGLPLCAAPDGPPRYGVCTRCRARVTCPTCRAVLAARDDVAARKRTTGLRPGPERADLARVALRRGFVEAVMVNRGRGRWWLAVQPPGEDPMPLLYVGDPLAEGFDA